MGRRRTTRIVLVQGVLPAYRIPFFGELQRLLGDSLLVVSGTEDWQISVEHSTEIPHRVAVNRYLCGRRLLWQSGVVRATWRAEMVILTLNPRVLSTWLVLILRRVLGRRTALWGHAWPRAGKAARTDAVRGLMRRLATELIVYTRVEAAELLSQSPRLRVTAAPNALYPRSAIYPAPRTSAGLPTHLVFSGRLTPEKRPEVLLEAFATAVSQLESPLELVVIGDGPSKSQLEQRASELGVRERVRFAGEVWEIATLRSLYADAFACAFPGDAGLAIVQSLGFGTPVILSAHGRHGPEIDAVVEGQNGVFFDNDSVEGIASAIVTVAQDRARWEALRASISHQIQESHSIESMAGSFVAGVARTASAAKTDLDADTA